MEAKEKGNMMGSDTEVCGDPKTWFPGGTIPCETDKKSFLYDI